MENILSVCIIIAILIFLGMFTVTQQKIAIVERFGKFHKIADSGLNFMIPFIDRIAGYINLKIRQLDIHIETKTKDNVFVKILVSVQFKAIEEKCYDAIL